MLSEAAGARHLERLGKLQMLLSETGLATHLLEQSMEIPFPLLIAGFHQDIRTIREGIASSISAFSRWLSRIFKLWSCCKCIAHFPSD